MEKSKLINFFSKKSVLILTGIFTMIMMVVVMAILSPIIEGGSDFGVVNLQLSFEKELGIKIVESWGENGVLFFKRYVFADYIYPIAYAMFLVSLLSVLLVGKNLDKSFYKYTLIFPIFSGLLDWIENTMEIFFMKNMELFSAKAFYFHSVIASTKFFLVGLTLIIAAFLWYKAPNSANYTT